MSQRSSATPSSPLLSPVNGRDIDMTKFEFNITDDRAVYFETTTDLNRADILGVRLESWQRRPYESRCTWDPLSPQAPRILRKFLWIAGTFPARSSFSSYAFSAFRLAVLSICTLLGRFGARSVHESITLIPFVARFSMGLFVLGLVSWTAHAGLNKPPFNPSHAPLQVLAPRASALWKPPATASDCVGDATLFELVAVAPQNLKSHKETVLMGIWAVISTLCLGWMLFNAIVLRNSQYPFCHSTLCRVYMVVTTCLEAPYYISILTLTALYGYVCIQLGKITQDSVDRSLECLHAHVEAAARADNDQAFAASITAQNSLAVIFRSRIVVQTYVKRVSERYRFIIAAFLIAMVVSVFWAVMDVVVYKETLDRNILFVVIAFIISLQALIFLWFPALLISGADNLDSHVRLLRGALGNGVASAQLASELSDLEGFLVQTKVAFFLFDQTLDMATAKTVTTALMSIFSVVVSVATKMGGLR